jgi:hypothetical protein
MLSKCASPACSNPFRYLHEGKLYLIESKASSGRGEFSADAKFVSRSRALEFAWLCSSCCRYMTIQNDDHGIRVVHKHEIRSSPEHLFLR